MTDLGRAVDIFFRPGEVKELRIFTTTGVMSGFYDDRLTLGKAAKAMGQSDQDEGVKAVYWTLNPINRSTLKFVTNGLNIRPKFATRTHNIEKRKWLLIDVDPARDSGTNATDAEKSGAKEVLDTVIAFLESKDWPDPVVVDSGNGYHALYRIDLPVTDNETVRNVLKTLAWKFDTAGAKVDQSVHDAVRICKVPGTWARKGPHSAERPHRISAILSTPRPIKTVSMTSLVGIKRFAPPAPPPTPAGEGAPISEKRLKEFFEVYSDELTVDSVRKKGAATHYSLAECPFHGGAHRDQKKAHKTDIIIDSDGARFKCFSEDCDSYKFQELLDLLEERTGTRFEIDDDAELAKRWGGIDHVTQEPTPPQDPSVSARAPAGTRYVTDLEIMRGLGGVFLTPDGYPETV